MSVRAKMVLKEKTERQYGATTVKFESQYDDSIPEDRRFEEATPTGSAEFQITNPRALEQFLVGRAYYVDFSPADEGE